MGKRKGKERKALRETAMFRMTGMRFQLLLYNAVPLIIVEFMYSGLSALVVGPLFQFLFSTLVSLSGIGTLTTENFLSFLIRPLPLLCTLALFICIGIYSLLDISAAIFTFDCSRQHKHVGVLEVAEFSIKNAVRIVKPRNIPILLVVTVMLPIMSMGVSSSFLSAFEIPVSALDVFRTNIPAGAALCVALIVMLILTFRWTFSMHYFTIERVDFFTAAKRSARLDRQHRILSLLSMLLVQAALALSNALLIFLGTRIALFCIATFNAQTFFGAFIVAIVFLVFGMALIVLNTLGMPISVLSISAKYYDLKESSNEELVPVAFKQRTVMRSFKRAVRITCGILLALTLLSLTALFMLAARGTIDILDSFSGDTKITGYRGGTVGIPEDTLVSIENAASLHAHMVSVDAQVSRDGVVFLGLSSNLTTISNINANAWEVDYSDIAGVSLSNSVFSSLYPDCGFPLLADAITTAQQNGVGLIIDVSELDYCTDGVERVAEVVRQSGYSSLCAIASRSYDDIVRVRAADSTLATVYIAGLAFGSFSTYTQADAIALESVAISQESINSLHASGLKAYGWCMSSKSAIEEAAADGIDNIVTTDIATARKAVQGLGLTDFGYTVFSELSTSGS